MVDAKTEDWIEIAQRGFENWKAKPHNARWFRKIDGTPIPNDLTICIGEAFAEPLRSLTLRVEAEKRAREEAQSYGGEARIRENAERAKFEEMRGRAEAAETHSAALARALEEAREALKDCADSLEGEVEDRWRLPDGSIGDYLLRAAAVEDQMIENAGDALDAGVARQRLRELKQGTVKVVRGKELAARLSRLESD